MNITKYEHACLVLEDRGQRLIIDPGDFSTSLPELNNVVAVVITHVHFDHFNNQRIEKILSNNPNATVFSVAEVKEKLPQTIVCAPGEIKQVGNFNLEFFGGQHAIIHTEYSKFENIGVLVNSSFYYGGDSLDKPNKPVSTLALPVSGPWLKTGEAMDYMAAIRPKLAFPTHDSLNSDAGNAAQDSWLKRHGDKYNIPYKRLAIGESIEVN